MVVECGRGGGGGCFGRCYVLCVIQQSRGLLCMANENSKHMTKIN